MSLKSISTAMMFAMVTAASATALAQARDAQVSNQAGTQTGPTSVIVTNTPAQPVPTKELTNPAFQPFEAKATISLPVGKTDDSATVFVVPAGKRLVIENVSAWGFTYNTSGTVPRVALSGVGGGVSSYLYVPLTWAGRSTGGYGDDYVGTHLVRMYIDAGSSLGVQLRRSNDSANVLTGSAGAYITIAGYFIDVP